VGTVVVVSGQVAPGCVPASGAVGIVFEGYLGTRAGGVDQVAAAVAPDGSFAIDYQVPADLGGAATRGLYAYATEPGYYQFRVFGGTGCSPSQIDAFVVTGPAAPGPGTFVALAPTPDGKGYWLAQAGGGVEAFGDAPFLGSLPADGVTPRAPITDIVATPSGDGYWLVGADGGVFGFGDAHFYGSLPDSGTVPYGPIVSFAPTAGGKGYWLLGADGGVFTFGDAWFDGAGTDWMSPFVAIDSRPDGGYDVATAGYGQIFEDPGDVRLSSLPVVSGLPQATSLSGASVTPSGDGGWQVGLDGGVFAFGDAPFLGSLPGDRITPAAPVVAVAGTPDGDGYWLLGADGGVFAFGDAGFFGSARVAG
jgi:hypothetical protein